MGRTINEADMNNTAPVVVIGPDIRDNLLGGTDPIGKEIRVDGHALPGDRRGHQGRQDAGPEPRQLGDDADYHLVQGVWHPQQL